MEFVVHQPQTRTTRVAAHDGAGSLRTDVRPIPAPGPGEMLLDLLCCGFCGTDLFKLDNKTVPAGTVLGHEFVGLVSEIGSSVSAFSVGDRVVVPHHVACGECPLCRRGSHTLCPVFKQNLMNPGGFAERVLIGARAVSMAARHIPDAVSNTAASFLEPGAAAWGCSTCWCCARRCPN